MKTEAAEKVGGLVAHNIIIKRRRCLKCTRL